MKTIQKPKRMWQKKKDYNKKKLIRKIRRRNKTSFDDGKDVSYQDWKTKASKYKHIDIDHDNTYDYEGWYNSDPDNAYRFLMMILQHILTILIKRYIILHLVICLYILEKWTRDLIRKV